jgi:hypothetical protein
MKAAGAHQRTPAAADDHRRLSGWHLGRSGQQNAEHERAEKEAPRQLPGTDKNEALDQLLMSDDVATGVATDLFPTRRGCVPQPGSRPTVLDIPDTAMYNAAMYNRNRVH